ncbi:MAG: WhiB family transcriptional regulator [Acidimicrobiaceae bacterium]|nr:WhiB family transcriptional regulator [Acidimicrobiaceae bacterium]
MTHRVESWRNFAACRGADPTLFFPETDKPEHRGQIAAAKAICAHCPVRDSCLEYALETRESFGIFGGLTSSERRRLRRTLAIGA